MGNEVLEDLNGCNPGLPLIGYTGFTAYTHDHLVMVHTIDQIFEGIWEDLCIGVNLFKRASGSRIRGATINTHHQANFKEVWSNSHEDVNLAE